MIRLNVNGEDRQFEGDPEMPLLWYLRDVLELTGTKFGCGAGLCGACTMHVDGEAVRTCVLPIAAVAGKRVTTIEGLGTPDKLHPLQSAWVAHSVPQCGYCQSGQIMSAASLLAHNQQPTAAEVDSAMSGNICRCGCYPRIKAAILAVAADTVDDLATEVTS